MNFGEKLVQLRKGKGMSQEDLAVLLKTTRQAVSKWENNQGYPETDKILLLSHIFEVSTDVLLKEEKTVQRTEDEGLYVSREMANGFLDNERKVSRYLGLGFLCAAWAGIPYVLFEADPPKRWLGIAIFGILGICMWVIGMFSDQEQYKKLREEPLIFDYAFLKEISAEYAIRKKKYRIVALPSTILFILGLLILIFTGQNVIPWSIYHIFIFLVWGVGLFGFVSSAAMMEAYELLTENEQFSKRFLFQLKRKIKAKLDLR